MNIHNIQLKIFPPELNLCANCGKFFGRVQKKDLNWDDFYANERDAEMNEEYLTVSCICGGRVCKNCGRYDYAPISNVYYKKSNTVEHIPYFWGMKGCTCGTGKFEKSVLDVEKYESLGEWYQQVGQLGYGRTVAMCAGIMRATKTWGLSIPEVFRLFLACEVIILAGKTFIYNLRGHEAIKKLYVHHCYDCDIWRVNTSKPRRCSLCNKTLPSARYNFRNQSPETCCTCKKKLKIGEGFLIGAWLHGYYRCQQCAIEHDPHLKVYFNADLPATAPARQNE